MKTLRYFILSLSLLLLLPVQSFAGDPAPVSPVNINTADVQTLAKTLKGIGPGKARAIVAYREKHGGFKSIDELVEVKGIGIAMINKNRPLMVLK